MKVPAGFTISGAAALSESVSISRFHHDNGLTALVCPDPASPLAAVQVWYRVGSANEQPGHTGIAHLFEHLMFNRTARVATGEFDRLIEELGGDCNAATWVDWTSYSITVPADDFELALRLEADRMVNLVLDGEVLEAERDVVINERLERVEDDIGGFLDEELARTAYEVHPYGWPTIGFMDDIRGLDLATIRRFYETYYSPNNAVVVVAGGVAEAEALAAIGHHFGGLKPATVPPRRCPVEPVQIAERVRCFEKQTATSRLLLAYHVPGQGHPDWPALAALAALLSGGPSARLYQQLVTRLELATYADSEVLPFREPSLFRVAVGGAVDTGADELLRETDRVVDQLVADLEPITDDEIDKVRSGTETDFWIELETADGKAEALGHFEATLGDFRALFETARLLGQVSADDVRRVARTYLVRPQRTVITGVPTE